ncbi:MAG: NADPH-dependent FMN reductase [Gammaproteobacteria bacterium]
MRFLVFLGSARASSPPNPPRLGERVARAVVAELAAHDQEAELIDPLNYDQAAVFRPHFSYAKGTAPADIEALADKIAGADGYVMVSPEYNHSMSPALAHLLNHFGSSLFSFRPSAIVTYSAGQWGGVRAGVALRPFLSELGCLPVSAMVHIPKAHEVFDETGAFAAGVDAASWRGYIDRTLAQLEWWAGAAHAQRTHEDPQRRSPAFRRDPAQRNAP